MNNENKTALVPKYRFPEFKSRGSVVCENGNLIFEPISNKNHNSDLPVLAITQEHGAIPREEIDYTVSVSEKGLENYKVVEQGDFIISLRSFQGGIEYSIYHGICSPAYIILRKKVDIVEQYYKHYFKFYKFIQDLNKDLEGIRDGKMVSYNQFSAILLPKPDKEEQQKITDCLSSLDELISSEDKKLTALKDHRKGLMQKLFPAEGKTLPEWRFPEFSGCGEWEETELGKLIELKGRIGYRGYTTEDIVKKGEGAISLSPTNITESGKLNFDKNTYISWQKYEESPEIMLEIGHIVLVKTGSSYGKSAIVTTLPQKTTINPQIVVIKPKKANAIFLSILVSGYSIQKQIRECAVGGAIPTLSQDNISKFNTAIPKTKEQQKIADVFSSVDKLITAQSDKIEALKEHRKGLMQGLFPSIEEVSQ